MISKEVMILARKVMVMAIVLSIVLLFVGIGGLIFVHVCIVGRALRVGFGNADSIGTAERGIAITTTTTRRSNSTSMSKQDLEKLPCFDFDQTKETSIDCAVCLDSFEVGDKCRLLPLCNHSFHALCVDVWLLKTPFCPICRACVNNNNNNINTIESRDIESQYSATILANEL